MNNINETIAEVLRLDTEATPGPWDEDGIYTGLRHLGKHCSDWYYCDSDGNSIAVPQERDAALIAYYRTAAPALAREVQRLQGEVRQAQTGHDCALVAAYESGLRAGQEAMRYRCASRAARDADRVCNCGRPICQPDCARVRLLDLAYTIRTLEVE
jgi:hypothetical protein